MTTVYLVRHATTEFNLNQILNGREDSRLAPLGLRQAAQLKKRFADLPLDAIYTSPLHRAVQTARAVRGEKPLKISTRSFLLEREMGSMSGRPVAEIDAELPPDQLQFFHHSPENYTFGGAETAQAVLQRVDKGMQQLIALHPGQTIAVVSHYFVLQVYLQQLLRAFLPQGARIRLPNASVTRLRFGPGGFGADYIGDEAHLPPDCRFPC